METTYVPFMPSVWVVGKGECSKLTDDTDNVYSERIKANIQIPQSLDEARIAAIKARILAGEYDITSDDVARRILTPSLSK